MKKLSLIIVLIFLTGCSQQVISTEQDLQTNQEQPQSNESQLGEHVIASGYIQWFLENDDGFYIAVCLTDDGKDFVVKSRINFDAEQGDYLKFEGIVIDPIDVIMQDNQLWSVPAVEVVTGTLSVDRQNEQPMTNAQVEHNDFSYNIINQDNWIILKDTYGTGYTWNALITVINDGNVPIYFGTTNFDLHTSDGKVITTGSLEIYPDILNPGEEGVFYGYVSLDSFNEEDGIVFTPRWSIEQSNNQRVDLSFSDIEVRDTDYGVTVVGNITNDSGKDQDWIIIQAILYDKDGNALGVWMINDMEAFKSGDSRAFVIDGTYDRTLGGVTIDQVASYTLFINPPTLWN